MATTTKPPTRPAPEPPTARPAPRGSPPAEGVGESPVEPGSLADEEGLDGLQYVTGAVPYQTQEERLLDEERTEPAANDDRDWEAPEEVIANPVASDERDDDTEIPDLDRQGRVGAGDRDWQGQMQADSGRRRPSDGSKRR